MKFDVFRSIASLSLLMVITATIQVLDDNP
jgi:hypothetical protein